MLKCLVPILLGVPAGVVLADHLGMGLLGTIGTVCWIIGAFSFYSLEGN